MIRIQILKNNIVTNQADFKTQLELDSWLLKEQANNSFGKNERELRAIKDADGVWYVPNEDILLAESFRDEEVIITPEIPADPEDPDSQPIPAVTEIRRYYSFAADYTFQITDVTAEYDAIKAKEDAVKAAREALKTTKPVMTALELSDAVNKILLILGVK